MSTLHEAIDTLSLDALRKALADDPASANAQHEGLTPLAYLATKKPAIEDYERLKNLGLANRDTTEQVVRNRTLHIYETMAKFIATAPAVDLNTAGSDGRTALHRAAQEANEDLVNVLIDGGADLNVQDDQGRTPIMVAETFTIRRILAYASADLKVQDTAGNTVLHLLLQKDPADPSSTALISKADPTLLLVKNKEGLSPDELADKKATHINERFAHYQEKEMTRKKAEWEEGFEEGKAGDIYNEMNAGCVSPAPAPQVVSKWRQFWSWCCCVRRPRSVPQQKKSISMSAIPMIDPAHQAVRSQVMKVSKDMLLKGTKFVEGQEEPIQKRERKPIVIQEFQQFTNEIAAAHVPAEMERTEFTTPPLHRQSNFTDQEAPASEIQIQLAKQQKELDEVFQILTQSRSALETQGVANLLQHPPTEQPQQLQQPPVGSVPE
jgi:hypothetical protein